MTEKFTDDNFFENAALEFKEAIKKLKAEGQLDFCQQDWLRTLTLDEVQATIQGQLVSKKTHEFYPKILLDYEETILTLANKIRNSQAPENRQQNWRESFRIHHFLIEFINNIDKKIEILKIFDLAVFVDFSEDEFFKVLEVHFQGDQIFVEKLQPDELLTLENLKKINKKR